MLKEKSIVSEQKYLQLTRQLKQEEEERPSMEYKSGLLLKPARDKFTLKIKGRMEADSIFFNKNHPSNDNFTVRRARLTITATAHKYFGFKLQPEFTGSSLLRDASVDITPSKQLQIRAGQFKTPFGLEWSLSSLSRDFMFRSMAVINLSPDRDRGILIQGKCAKGKANYAIGIMNGSRPNQNDADKHKDIVGRLAFRPTEGLHLGGSFTYGKQNVSMASDSAAWWSQGRLQNPGSGTTFFQFADGVTHNGARLRYGIEGAWINGPFSVKTEWLRVQMNDLAVGSQKGNFHIDGYYIALSYFLTGEEQIFKNGAIARVKPNTNFDPDNNTWGGVQLIARYDQVTAEDSLRQQGYVNPSMYTSQARSYTVGANWYLNEFIRVMIDYVHADFDSSILVGSGHIDNEDTFMTRFQIAF